MYMALYPGDPGRNFQKLVKEMLVSLGVKSFFCMFHTKTLTVKKNIDGGQLIICSLAAQIVFHSINLKMSNMRFYDVWRQSSTMMFCKEHQGNIRHCTRIAYKFLGCGK